jgi:hypothetical protein
MPDHKTTYDTVILRDTLKVTCKQTEKVNINQEHNYDSFVLRFLYKHNEGILWCFNKPLIDKQWFKEIPHPSGNGITMNRIIDSQEQRDFEEDEENDVDLEKSMWLIVRKKQSVNQVLKDFCPEYQAHSLRVRDIIKFGRVNFKITTLQCDRIKKEFQGSCYSQVVEV